MSFCGCVCTEKDVARTDRTHTFFQGENNPNITVLYDILLTHCMYNFDLGQPQISFCLFLFILWAQLAVVYC